MSTLPRDLPTDAAELLQLVMDNIPQFIFWKDRRSVYLGCNENFARAAGVPSPEAIVGKTDLDLAWKPEEAAFFREVDERVMSSGEPEYRILEPQLQADGKQAWIETNKVPLRDGQGRVVGILGTYEDVTSRVQAEERLRHVQRMESIGELAGGLAHEFNNLLTGIVGLTETLRAGLAPQSSHQRTAEQILATSARAADLTHKLLAFSRRGRLQSCSVDLHALVRDVAAFIGHSVEPTVRLKVELTAQRAVLTGDPSELQAALVNLALNARDAMPHGGTLTLRTTDVELDAATCEALPFDLRPGPHLCLEVQDTGSGMSADVQARIFEPFFTTKPQGTASGLGLAATYGVVLEHRGAIEVHSAPGEGARFRLLLPSGEAPAAEASGTRDSVKSVPPGGFTILVVDDEDVVRETAQALLATLGYKVLCASDGLEAVELYRERGTDIDLVLLDVRMPRMDGTRCLQELRAIDPGVRVVFSSGFTEEAVPVHDSGGMAADGFLNKPYRRAELSEAVRQALT